MKKFYTLIALMTIAAFSFGQMIPATHGGGKLYNGKIEKKHSQQKATNTFYIDYDAAENALYGGDPNYKAYYWDTNNAFNAASPSFDTANAYVIVAFDSLYDYVTDVTYDKANVTSYTIDSIFAIVLHKNTTTTTNHWIFSVIALDGTGYPDENVVLHKDTVTTTTTLDPGYVAGDNFNSTACLIGVASNFSLPAGVTEYAVKLEFEGSKSDSAAFLAGWAVNPSGACAYDVALTSLFATNSYSLFASYVPRLFSSILNQLIS